MLRGNITKEEELGGERVDQSITEKKKEMRFAPLGTEPWRKVFCRCIIHVHISPNMMTSYSVTCLRVRLA
jgi:hypothetical protein